MSKTAISVNRTACLLLLMVLVAPIPGGAATYYVAPPPAGSNGNPGTSAQPWATLQHAADQVNPGDTVLVRTGNYAAFEMTTSGQPGARISFRAPLGETVRIVTDVPGRGAGINLEGASYITIEGFRIADRATVGIRAVLCDAVWLYGNILEDNGKWGILTGCCDDLVISGNLASGSVIEHGIYVSNSGDRPTITGNVIFGNNANGIHMNGDASIDCDGTTPWDGVISNATVTRNTIFDNGAAGGSGINCDSVQSSLIANNLIYASHASGISLYQIDGGAPASGNRVEHNTVLVASNGRWALNIQDDASGTTVRNNILWSEHSFRGAVDVCDPGCLVGLSSDYNAVESRFTLDGGSSVLALADWQGETGQDSHSIAISSLPALFVSAALGNYRLALGSDAVDIGIPTDAANATDLDGVSRPQGSAPDQGAFEGEDRIFGDGFEPGSLVRWSAWSP